MELEFEGAADLEGFAGCWAVVARATAGEGRERRGEEETH